MGTPLFPWQRYVADVALEVDDRGEWVYDEVVITVPRRSGKTFLVKPVTAHRCGSGQVAAWITAQKRNNAVRRWRETVDGLLGTPLRTDLRRKISIGNEELRWASTGSTFRPFRPDAEAMHGEDPGLVWVDELWAFDAETRAVIEQGYRPAFSVQPGQAWLLSTAGTVQSSWLNAVRRQGRAEVESGGPARRAYFEWSVPELVGSTPVEKLKDGELLRLVVDHHPRRDHGLRADFLAGELVALGRPDFLRAYGNLTPAADDEGTFPVTVMERSRSGAQIPGDARIGLGVAVDPDRRDASIGICVRDGLGVAVTDDRRRVGTRWVASEVIRLVDQYDVGQVAVVGAGPARSIADELDRAGVPLLRLSQADAAAAAAGFADEFGDEHPSVTWNGGEDFRQAVLHAKGQRRNSGLVWESRTGESIVSLDARTMAVWAFDHAPVPEPVVEPRVY